MFKVDENPTFRREVKVRTPIDGGYKTETLSATFRVLDTNVIDAHDFTTERGVRAFLCEAVEKLDDIADMKGNPLEYSDALRDRLFSLPYVRRALTDAYLGGVAGGREGN